MVCAGSSVPLDNISIRSEKAEIIGSFPSTHLLCRSAFIIASRNALLPNRGTSFLSTTWNLLNSIYHITYIPNSHDSKKRIVLCLPNVSLKCYIISAISLCNDFKFCIRVLLLKFIKR